MLEHLDSLDDATPPAADTAMLTRVRDRAARRRLRNRLAAGGAIVATLAIAVGGVAVARDRNPKLDVTNPAPTTASSGPTPTTSPNPVIEGTTPDGLHVRLTLETPSVVVGDNIEARVDIRNDTTETKTIGVGAIQCVLDIGPVLRDSHGRTVVDGTQGVGCYDMGRSIAPGGSTTVDVSLSTDSVEITSDQRGKAYQLSLERISGMTPQWSLGSVPVDVIGPVLSGHIELPATTFTVGESITGALVIDNSTGAPVHYTVDCNGEKPWSVVLADHGVHFDIPVAGVGCARAATVETLPPGTTRLPFGVVLGYPSCSGGGPVTPDRPRCVAGGIPDIAPGDYEIAFEGSAAFRALNVTPVSIQVRAKA
jgi:hypothetical protein